MEHLQMQSRDMVSDNIKYIAERWPECLTEAKDENGKLRQMVDFDKLRQVLSADATGEGQERYQFTWPDKRHAIRLANAPITDTLRPCREESVDWNTTQNLYIEGDNLNVLKLLRESYLGKVKMIYIDPPYNTGGDFVYKDNFIKKNSDYAEVSGAYDKEGNLLVGELEKNADSNGRFHTDWLNMIYPRLKVARDLLSEDGVIFISIDENELHNLKKIADEVLGASNYLAEFVWSAGRKNDSKHVSLSHEYIVCYFKNFDYIKEHKIVWREKKQGLEEIYMTYDRLKKQHGADTASIERELKAWFRSLPNGHPAKDHKHYSSVDQRGIFFPDNISWPGGGGPKYEVLHPTTHKPVKIPSRGWITSKENLTQWIADDLVCFGEDETAVPTVKAYLKDREFSVPYSVFYQDGRAASKRLAQLLGDKVFENPKDDEIIQRIIQFVGVKDNEIVLDFFSGSGTTAQAVLQANLATNSHIKFILVQLQEEIDPSKSTSEKGKKVAQNAISLLNKLGKPHYLTEIAKERIRRAGKKIKEENPKAQDLDTGFRVLKLDSSNMQDVFYAPAETTQQNLFADNIKPDRTGEDLLVQVMMELGIQLSDKIEKTEIAGKTVWNVSDGYLMACFDADVNEDTIKAIAKQKPAYFVLADRSLASDNVADNFEQLFEEYSPDTVRRII